MSTPGEDPRWRMRRGTPQQNAQNSSQQGRPNQSRDRGSYGYASGNAWTNRAPPPGQPAALVDEHVPVRGFNSREVSEYMNRAYVAALNSAQNPYPDEATKPLVYKSPENPWKTTGKGPWGSRLHVMANGTDFLSQLRKGVGALPPPSKE